MPSFHHDAKVVVSIWFCFCQLPFRHRYKAVRIPQVFFDFDHILLLLFVGNQLGGAWVKILRFRG